VVTHPRLLSTYPAHAVRLPVFATLERLQRDGNFKDATQKQAISDLISSRKHDGDSSCSQATRAYPQITRVSERICLPKAPVANLLASAVKPSRFRLAPKLFTYMKISSAAVPSSSRMPQNQNGGLSLARLIYPTSCLISLRDTVNGCILVSSPPAS
jgi:hypothetical protein